MLLKAFNYTQFCVTYLLQATQLMPSLEITTKSPPKLHYLKSLLCAQQTLVQLTLVLIQVTDGGRKGICTKLLLCTSKSPTLVPQYLGRHV